MFIYKFGTLASAAAFPSITSSSWFWHFRCLKAFPLDYIIFRNLALFASSCAPLDVDSFSIRSHLLHWRGELRWHFPGGRVLGGIFHIPLSLFVVEHTAWRYGITASDYRYTNLRVGELWTGLALRIWCLPVLELTVAILSNIRFDC